MTEAPDIIRRVIALDGPAGSGKSTVARLVALQLGFVHADSGAIYRTITLAAMRRFGEGRDADEFAETISSQPDSFEILGVRVVISNGHQINLIDGEDPGDAIRSAAVTSRIKPIADSRACRLVVNRILREFAGEADLVVDGRDMGTVVFPQAGAKFYIEASASIRAARRQADFEKAGRTVGIEELESEISRRDQEDKSRAFGALVQAPDAILIDTTPLALNDVVARILAHLQVQF